MPLFRSKFKANKAKETDKGEGERSMPAPTVDPVQELLRELKASGKANDPRFVNFATTASERQQKQKEQQQKRVAAELQQQRQRQYNGGYGTSNGEAARRTAAANGRSGNGASTVSNSSSTAATLQAEYLAAQRKVAALEAQKAKAEAALRFAQPSTQKRLNKEQEKAEKQAAKVAAAQVQRLTAQLEAEAMKGASGNSAAAGLIGLRGGSSGGLGGNAALVRRPSKAASIFNTLFANLSVTARQWDAPTDEELALGRAREAVGRQRQHQDKQIRALRALVNEVQLQGGSQVEILKILQDYMDRKITGDEAEKKLKNLDGTVRKAPGEMTEAEIAEQEEITMLEIEHKKLLLKKLRMDREDKARHELEEIQKRLKSLGLPYELRPRYSGHGSHYDHYYGGRGHNGHGLDPEDYVGNGKDEAMFGGFDDLDDIGMIDHDDTGGSEAFGDSMMLNPSRYRSLPSRSQSLPAHLYEDAEPHPLSWEERDAKAAKAAIRSASAGGAVGLSGPLLAAGGGGGGSRNVGAIPAHKNPGYRQMQASRQRRAGLAMAGESRGASLDSSQHHDGSSRNFRISSKDPRLDPHSQFYKLSAVKAYKEQQIREHQAAQLAKQAEEERVRRLELEKRAALERRQHDMADAQAAMAKRDHQAQAAHLIQHQVANAQAAHAAQEAQDAAARDAAAVRRELEEVRRLEDRVIRMEELERLENLLRANPRAAIPGLDRHRLQNDPRLLYYALRQVEENIRMAELVQPNRAAYDREEEELRRERESVARLERSVAHAAELDRLERLLREHPHAEIKGLDMNRLADDPAFLQHALEQVESSIQRGELPVHIRSRLPSDTVLNEALTQRQVEDQQHRLYQQFLAQTAQVQEHHLRTLRDAAARQQFLESALAEASPVQAYQLAERFKPYGFNLPLPPEIQANARSQLSAAAPAIPTIVIDHVKSPSPTQDSSPHVRNRGALQNESPVSSAWQPIPAEMKGKGKEVLTKSPTPPETPTYRLGDGNHTGGSPVLAGPSGRQTLPPERTSAAHPSGQVAAEMLEADGQQSDDPFADDEADFERERKEIAEAEAALVRQEGEEKLAAQAEEMRLLMATQEEARLRAAEEIEAAAQARALEIDTVDDLVAQNTSPSTPHAEDDGWPALPTPPRPFTVDSPAHESFISPKSKVATPEMVDKLETEDIPEAEEPPPAIEDDPAWGEASAEVEAALDAASKAKSPSIARSTTTSPNATSLHSVPASRHSSPKVTSPAKVGSTASKANSVTSSTPKASPGHIGSPVKSPEAVLSALKSPSIGKSPPSASVKASSPNEAVVASPGGWVITTTEKPASQRASPASQKSATPVPSVQSTPKVNTITPPKTPTPVIIKEATPILPRLSTPRSSPAKSATPKAASPRDYVVAQEEAASVHTPTIATPVVDPVVTSATAISSPPRHSSPAKSPKGESPVVNGWTLPKTSPTKSPVASPPLAGGWSSPPPEAVLAKASPAPQAEMWLSPGRKAAASPAGSLKSDVWGALPSPAKSSPSLHQEVVGWGDTVDDREASPTQSIRSAAISRPASRATSMHSKRKSPAFGLGASSPSSRTTGDNTPSILEGPRTAIKGSDPVVVSMAAPITPQEVGVPTHVPQVSAKYPRAEEAEEDEEYYEEEEEEDGFDLSDFRVYMQGEGLEEGIMLSQVPPAQPFHQNWPKTGPEVTEDAVIDHYCRVALQHGYNAIMHCATMETEEMIRIQGYFVLLVAGGPMHSEHTYNQGGEPAGGVQGNGKNKATYVSESSEAGW